MGLGREKGDFVGLFRTMEDNGRKTKKGLQVIDFLATL
jgi:hypothetical protein